MKTAPAILPARAPRKAATHPLLSESSLFYDPPYERPVDDHLAWHLVKYLAPNCALQYRTVALTPDDCFRVDFLIEQETPGYGTRRFGLLCGEREDEEAPCLRDALVVGAGAVDVLYRFREESLERHLQDVLFLVSRWDPALFEASGRVRLHEKASAQARAYRVWPGEMEARLTFEPAPVEVRPGALPERPAPPTELVVRRLSRHHPGAWQQEYKRALDYFGLSERHQQQPVRWAQRA